jgi:hypothetical protein
MIVLHKAPKTMKKIENNPNLNWTRVRRLFARWVNHVRTSDAHPRSREKGLVIDTQHHIPSQAHHLGDFTAAFVQSWGSLKVFNFYNAYCGIAIKFEIGIRNDGRESEESKSSDVKLITLNIYEATPIEKKEPGHIQPILTSNQLCSITYLIGQHASARTIIVNGRSVEEFEDLNPLTIGPCIWVFLDFVKSVIECNITYHEFFKQHPRTFIPFSKNRKVGWKNHTDITTWTLMCGHPKLID